MEKYTYQLIDNHGTVLDTATGECLNDAAKKFGLKITKSTYGFAFLQDTARGLEFGVRWNAKPDNHIIILVRGGCVQEVYANRDCPPVNVEMIDCDGDDLEKRERADLIEAEKKAGKWHTLPY